MRNKLLALILVLVIVVLTLASCNEYSYLEDNMSAYTTVSDSIKTDLKSLTADGGDFVIGDRDNIIKDETYKALAAAVADYEAATSGRIGAYDTISYCTWYYVIDADEKMHIVTVSMDPADPDTFQNGLSTNDALNVFIGEALVEEYKEGEEGKDFVGLTSEKPSYTVTYTKTVGEETATETENVSDVCEALATAVKNADYTNGVAETIADVTDGETTYSDISAQYTYGAEDHYVLVSYTETIPATEAGAEPTTITYTNTVMELYEDAETPNIGSYLCGKNLTDVADNDTYSDITVSALLAGSSVKIKYTSPEKQTAKDDAGNTFTIEEGAELAYFIFPVSVIATPEKTAKNILIYAIGDELATTSLDCLGEDDVKDLVTDLIADDNKLISEFLAADKTYNDDPTEDNKTAKETAKTALDAKIDPVIEKVESKINEQYIHDSKLSTYNTTLKTKLIEAIYGIITDSQYFTDSGKLPEDAVDDQYDQLISNYKKALYSSDNTGTYAEYANKLNPFEDYLMDVTETSSYSAAKDAVRKEAEDYVRAIVHIYAVAEKFGCEYTTAEFEEYKKEEPAEGYSSNEYLQRADSYADADIMTAKQFDKLMNTIIGDPDWDAETPSFSDYLPALADMDK